MQFRFQAVSHMYFSCQVCPTASKKKTALNSIDLPCLLPLLRNYWSLWSQCLGLPIFSSICSDVHITYCYVYVLSCKMLTYSLYRRTRFDIQPVTNTPQARLTRKASFQLGGLLRCSSRLLHREEETMPEPGQTISIVFRPSTPLALVPATNILRWEF